MRRLFRIPAATFVVVGMLLSASMPATAAQVQGKGFFAVWDDTDIVHLHGIVLVDRTSADKPRVTLGVTSAMETELIHFTFRSIGCNGTPRAANRMFRLQSMTDANGGLYLQNNLSPSINFDVVKSVWVDVDRSACLPVKQFQRVAAGDVNGDDALGIISDKATPKLIVAVEGRPANQARVSIFVDGKGAGDEFNARGTARACGRSASASGWFVPDMDSDQSGMAFESTTVDLTHAQLVDLSSVRLTNQTTGNRWCAPMSIIAVLIGM